MGIYLYADNQDADYDFVVTGLVIFSVFMGAVVLCNFLIEFLRKLVEDFIKFEAEALTILINQD